jgi:tripartite-type tricarboxylate transporter receptor subunit TctC
MKTRRRSLLKAAAGTALAAAVPAARAQAWPSKSIVLVCPQAVGGTSDILSRLMAERLGARLGQAVVVENRVGAGGNLGTGQVAQAAPDGHTLVLGYVGTFAVNPALYPSVPFDPVDSFTHIVGLADVPLMLAVRADSPARNVDELAQLARGKSLNYGSAGNGTMNHMAGELLNQTAKVKITHVPYRGVAASVTDLLGGQVDLVFASIPSTIGHIKSGKLRALAVTSAARTRALPDVPTMLESRSAPVTVVTWYSLAGPKGLPAAVVSRVQAETLRILEAPDMRERLEGMGAVTWTPGPEQLVATVRQDLARWTPIVKASGAKVD